MVNFFDKEFLVGAKGMSMFLNVFFYPPSLPLFHPRRLQSVVWI